MKGSIRSKLTFSNVIAGIALFVVFTTGTAYAGSQINGNRLVNGTVTGTKLTNNTVQSIDIQNNQVNSGDLRDNSIKSQDVLEGTLTSGDILDSTITAADLATNSVGSSEIAAAGVGTSEVADNSLGAGDLAAGSVGSSEVADFSLSNADVGVLWAQVNGNGTLFSSSGGVSSSRVNLGDYEVDFGRTVSGCAAVVSQGAGNVGGSNGAIMGATDRAGNVEAFFVSANDAAGADSDQPFQIVVVC